VNAGPWAPPPPPPERRWGCGATLLFALACSLLGWGLGWLTLRLLL
jgi:hypothetical protein